MVVTDLTQYDLTGTDLQYRRVNRRFVVFGPNQKIDFQEAVYPNSIIVHEMLTNGELIEIDMGTPQDGNKAWSCESETCTDSAAMSRAKAEYNARNNSVGGWNERLVNCIYMQDIVTPDPEYTIVVEYQALEKDVLALHRDNLGPEYSPGLMRTLVYKVDELIKLRNPVEDYSADTLNSLRCMPEDLTGHAASNFVEREEHIVSSSKNKYVVRPQNGSFYGISDDLPNNVVIDYIAADLTRIRLEAGSDYEIVGINHEKTAISYPSEGVYEFIVFKTAIEGTIQLTYHAFGGEVTQADINTLKEVVRNIYQTLDDKQLVTVDNLHQTEMIRNINYRLALIEETIKHYQVQLFKYVPELQDNWASIAFVPDNVWSEDAGVPENTYGEFRIEIPELEYCIDIKVSYDTVAGSLKLSVYHVEAPTFEEYGVEYFAKRILPKFRLIWNSNLDNGVMLQMSATRGVISSPLQVRVADRTGANSHWVLIDNQNTIRPEGTAKESQTRCEFPNGNVWTSTDGFQTKAVPVHPNGYTIMYGSIDVNVIENNSVSHDSNLEDGGTAVDRIGYDVFTGNDDNCLRITGNDIDFGYITGVRFKLFDRVTQSYRYGETKDIDFTENGIRAAAMYFYDDMCTIESAISYEEGIGYSMTLFTRTGTNSRQRNRFVLKQIDLLSSVTETIARVYTTPNDGVSTAEVDAPMSLTRANTVVNFGRL